MKQAKKFAKPELRVCVEEFEDKLNKFHAEKKEQEVTARNAQIHHQKIGQREGFVITRNSKEDGAESDISEGQCDQLWLNFIINSSFFQVSNLFLILGFLILKPQMISGEKVN